MFPRERICNLCKTSKPGSEYRIDPWVCNSCANRIGGPAAVQAMYPSAPQLGDVRVGDQVRAPSGSYGTVGYINSNERLSPSPIKDRPLQGFDNQRLPPARELVTVHEGDAVRQLKFSDSWASNPASHINIYESRGEVPASKPTSSPPKEIKSTTEGSRYVQACDGSWVIQDVQSLRSPSGTASGKPCPPVSGPCRSCIEIPRREPSTVPVVSIPAPAPVVVPAPAPIVVPAPAPVVVVPAACCVEVPARVTAAPKCGCAPCQSTVEQSKSLRCVYTEQFVDPHHRAYGGQVERLSQSALQEYAQDVEGRVVGIHYAERMPSEPLLGAPGANVINPVVTSVPKTTYSGVVSTQIVPAGCVAERIVERPVVPCPCAPVEQIGVEIRRPMKSVAQYTAEVNARKAAAPSAPKVVSARSLSPVRSVSPPKATASSGSSVKSVAQIRAELSKQYNLDDAIELAQTAAAASRSVSKVAATTTIGRSSPLRAHSPAVGSTLESYKSYTLSSTAVESSGTAPVLPLKKTW